MTKGRNRTQAPPAPKASRGERVKAADAAKNGTVGPTVVELDETEQLRAQNFLLEKQLVDERKAKMHLQGQLLDKQKELLLLSGKLLDNSVSEVEENRKGWLTKMGVEDGDNVTLQKDRLLISRKAEESTVAPADAS